MCLCVDSIVCGDVTLYDDVTLLIPLCDACSV